MHSLTRRRSAAAGGSGEGGCAVSYAADNGRWPNNNKRRTARSSATTCNKKAIMATRIEAGHQIISAATVLNLPPQEVKDSQKAVYTDWVASDWASAFSNHQDRSSGVWLQAEYGKIPPDIAGSYFRNGPGLFKLGDSEANHPFDGDGLVCTVRFQGGRAFFDSKLVQTRESQLEQEQGERIFRCAFGTKPSENWSQNLLNIWVKNVANTAVVCWAGKLWALFESAQPYCLDPTSLATLGMGEPAGWFSTGLPFDTGLPWIDAIAGWLLRRLHPQTFAGYSHSVLGGDGVSAHPRVDPLLNRLVTFKYRLRLGLGLQGLRLRTLVTLLELDASGDQVSAVEYELEGYAFLHDFVFTPTHYILHQNPVAFDLLPFILGQRSAIHSVRWQEGTPIRIHIIPRTTAVESSPIRIHIIPRTTAVESSKGSMQCNGSRVSRVIDAPSAFVFHHANCFESSDGDSITVDSIAYPELPNFHLFCGDGRNWRDVDPDTQPPSRLVRQVIHLPTGEVSTTTVSPRVMEFPTIPQHLLGSRTRYVYTASARHPSLNRPQQALAKVDVESGKVDIWTRGHRYYVGEPMFLPRSRPGTDRCMPAVDKHNHLNAQATARSLVASMTHGGPPWGSTEHGGPGVGSKSAEDDGWLLAICFDAALRRSEVVILDAADVSAGPVVVLPLPYSLPHGLHGSWLPEV